MQRNSYQKLLKLLWQDLLDMPYHAHLQKKRNSIEASVSGHIIQKFIFDRVDA